MSEISDYSTINYAGGSVMFSPDVVATIAGIAALKVEGVAGMSGGITDGIVQILGFKNLKKGVKAEITENEASVALNIVVKYECDMQKVCRDVQNEVKDAVETMTGLNAAAINVTVQGVNFDGEDKEKEKKSK